MPAWLRDSKTQGSSHHLHALPDPSGETEEIEEQASSEIPRTASEDAETKPHKETGEKKSVEGVSEGALAAAGASVHEENEKKKKKKRSGSKDTHKEKHGTANSKSSRTVAPISPGDLNRLRELVVGTFKNKYGSLAHAFAEMDVNKSDIVDADVNSTPIFSSCAPAPYSPARPTFGVYSLKRQRCSQPLSWILVACTTYLWCIFHAKPAFLITTVGYSHLGRL